MVSPGEEAFTPSQEPIVNIIPRWRRSQVAILITLMLLSGLSTLLITSRGLRVAGGDPIFYLTGAVNLSQGAGFQSLDTTTGRLTPITHYLPLYSLLISLLLRFSLPLDQAVHLLNAILMAGNTGIVFAQTHYYTGGKTWPAAAAASVLATSLPVVYLHTNVITDPLMLLCGSISLFVLFLFENNPRPFYLILATLFMALTLTSRYAALPFFLASIVLTLLNPATSRQTKVKRSAILSLALLPLLLWLIHNQVQASNTTNRSLAFHFVSVTHYMLGLTTLGLWIVPLTNGMPFGFGGWLGSVLIAEGLILLGSVLAYRRNQSFWSLSPRRKMIFLMVPGSLSLFVLLLSLFDSPGPMGFSFSTLWLPPEMIGFGAAFLIMLSSPGIIQMMVLYCARALTTVFRSLKERSL